MSIRVTALYIYVAVLLAYAWKDWFKSLCGLIFLMSVLEYEDMPRTMLGIPGLNLWNVLFGVIFLSWLANRRREGLKWDMPRHINWLLLMYLGVILIGVLRAALDRSYIEWYPVKGIIQESLFNTVKWILPGLLLFDGCRTRRRLVTALVCLLALYFMISVLVIRRLPAEAAFSNTASIRLTRTKLQISVGYNACDLSTMLAGVSWGLLATLPLVRKRRYWPIVLVAFGTAAFGQALTGGRAGYAAWGATGLVLCLLKWRKYLILAPVVVILLPIVFPGVAERMLEGFGQTDESGQTSVDTNEITSGRTLIWPHVIDKIGESPLIGHGRLAMRRTGLVAYLSQHHGENPAHPHNMYLETLLDNGILGSLPIFLFWGAVIIHSARLFRSKNCLCASVGGLALALTLAQLFGGIGAQHVYPSEGTLGLWAAIFLSLRVYVEEKRVQTNAIRARKFWNSHALIRRQVPIVSGYA